MKTYVSLIRGVNVGGRKGVPMDEFKRVYALLDLKGLMSYRQSGNLLFAAPQIPVEELEKRISRKIEQEIGLSLAVIVMESQTLEAIVRNNPFSQNSGKNPAFIHLSFLAETPGDFDESSIREKAVSREEIEFGPRVIYLYCPHGYGTTKLHNAFLESRLGVSATTRNWNTARALVKLARTYSETG